MTRLYVSTQKPDLDPQRRLKRSSRHIRPHLVSISSRTPKETDIRSAAAGAHHFNATSLLKKVGVYEVHTSDKTTMQKFQA